MIKQAFLNADGAAYAVVDGVWGVIAPDWNSLSEAQKTVLFSSVNGTPTTSQMLNIGKFRILVCDDTGTGHVCTLSGLPSAQVVKPCGLLSTRGYSIIHSMSATANVPAVSASIKIAITNDLETYFAYDFRFNVWRSVDVNDAADFLEHGMDCNKLATLTEAQIGIINARNRIAFAYLLDSRDISQFPSLDKLTVNVDITEVWERATHPTDFTYRYPSEDMLQVSLLTDGSYKINYYAGDASEKGVDTVIEPDDTQLNVAAVTTTGTTEISYVEGYTEGD